jgi:hypothetical protein
MGMHIYTVHAPPAEGQGEAPDRTRLVFIKDGIAWLALFVPVLWILWHRLWLTLLWYVAFVLVVAWIDRLAGDDLATLAGLLGQILFALEANNIRRWSLHSRGFDDVGESFGRNVEEAEMRYFLDPAPTHMPAPAKVAEIPKNEAITRAAYPQRSQDDEAIFGLFPEPER